MTQLPSLDDIFGGGGAYLEFKAVGTKHTGIIQNMRTRQQTDFDTNEPLTFPDGTPKPEVVITLTNAEHPEGVRLFARGLMIKAIREAVAKAGATAPEVGGVLTIAYTGDGERQGKKNPPKQYAAAYLTPAAAALAGVVPPAAPAAAPAAATTPAPASPAPVPDQTVLDEVDPAALAALLGNG